MTIQPNEIQKGKLYLLESDGEKMIASAEGRWRSGTDFTDRANGWWFIERTKLGGKMVGFSDAALGRMTITKVIRLSGFPASVDLSENPGSNPNYRDDRKV